MLVTINHIRNLLSNSELNAALSILEHIILHEKYEDSPPHFIYKLRYRLAALQEQLNEIEYKRDLLDKEFMANRRARIAQELLLTLREIEEVLDRKSWIIEASYLPGLERKPVEDLEITLHGDFAQFSEEDRQTFMDSISELLKMGKHNIKIERGDGG